MLFTGSLLSLPMIDLRVRLSQHLGSPLFILGALELLDQRDHRFEYLNLQSSTIRLTLRQQRSEAIWAPLAPLGALS